MWVAAGAAHSRRWHDGRPECLPGGLRELSNEPGWCQAQKISSSSLSFLVYLARVQSVLFLYSVANSTAIKAETQQPGRNAILAYTTQSPNLSGAES
jgi:hypothetical protein